MNRVFEVAGVINHYEISYGYSPTTGEIARDLDMTVNMIMKCITWLKSMGFISIDNDKRYRKYSMIRVG